MPTDPIMVYTENRGALYKEPRIFAHLPRIGETIWHKGYDSDELWVVIEVVHTSVSAVPAPDEGVSSPKTWLTLRFVDDAGGATTPSPPWL